MTSISAARYEKSVFINAPFDAQYKPLFEVIVFSIIDCGFVARCALEIEDGSRVRLDKIFDIIGQCRLAVHDLSRTELDTKYKLPRFNMPLELGIFLGAKRFGRGKHAKKTCIILDTKRFRYQKFISDIAGQDPREHANKPSVAIEAVRNWLVTEAPKNGKIPSAKIIAKRFRQFQSELPRLCRQKHWDERSLTFKERVELMFRWIEDTPLI